MHLDGHLHMELERYIGINLEFQKKGYTIKEAGKVQFFYGGLILKKKQI